MIFPAAAVALLSTFVTVHSLQIDTPYVVRLLPHYLRSVVVLIIIRLRSSVVVCGE